MWQVAGVQYILDSVVASLQEDPNRKFIYVEQVSLTPEFPFPCCDHRRSYDDRRFSYDRNGEKGKKRRGVVLWLM
jgi:hypothetical protein